MEVIPLTLCIVLIVLSIVALFMIAPSRSNRAYAWRGTLFAHRGLHENGLTENTAEAFEAACERGFGIELDVQLSRDGEVVVFHDVDLKRMANDDRRVDQVDSAELRTIELVGGGHISTFQEALALVNGRVPLLVELKYCKHNAELCRKTASLLKSYSGEYIIESFNPLIVQWWRRHEPETIRGQLVGAKVAYQLASAGRLTAFVLSKMLLNFLGRPDFIAYDINAHKFAAPKLQRTLFHTSLAAWTVNDAEVCQGCLERGEMPIFEGFIPEKP